MDGVFRIYHEGELGPDGYPTEWHTTIKHVVRQQANHRCVRCLHPFVVGESGHFEGPQANVKAMAASIGVNSETLDAALFELPLTMELDQLERAKRQNWSTCDEQCRHGGPCRARVMPGRPWEERDEGPQFPISQGNEAEAAWRILTVHHLNGSKNDCRWWNLAALCQRCHLEIQGRVKMEQIYPFEHTDWFKPYAAGYYAWTYLALELDREETEDRLEELLALELAA